MPYQAEISRAFPTCFVFLIDQSKSMSMPFAGGRQSKADTVSDVVNRLLSELIYRCQKDGAYRHYFDIGVVGYGASLGPILGGKLAGKGLVSSTELAENEARVERRMRKVPDGIGGLTESPVEFPIWVEVGADGYTPMCGALEFAHGLLEDWTTQHPHSFPPVVMNLTDGASTDGPPTDVGRRIQSLSTSDGQVLLFNLHVTSLLGAQPVLYPDRSDLLPHDENARMLYGISSALPDGMRKSAEELGAQVTRASRGFVYHGDLVSAVQFFDIGTRSMQPSPHGEGSW